MDVLGFQICTEHEFRKCFIGTLELISVPRSRAQQNVRIYIYIYIIRFDCNPKMLEYIIEFDCNHI
jgi:hypothetical protein